jgi:3-methyladenine DNA glycosylase AlkD
MNATEALAELEKLGNESTRKTLLRHGAREPLFGVKIGDMQKLRKQIKVDHQLALDLFDSGNYDAMYFAHLIADDARMTKTHLRKWVKNAYGASLAGTVVPAVAAGSPHGEALALEWIDAANDTTAAAGWNTLSHILSVTPDEELDLPKLKKLIKRAEKEIHKAGNEAKYAMNGFVIAAGCFVTALFDAALEAAEKIGPVEIDHGDNACKTPFAPEYLRKVEKMGRIGKKKKSAKC